MGESWRALRRDARGATAVEYGLIVALVVIAVMAGIGSAGRGTGGLWSNMTNKVVAVSPQG